jgi:hypothetical protein
MSVQTLSSNGQFNNQGVLAGNLNGTPALIGFPQTSTSNSVGMYQHLGIAGSPNLETNFLNASATTTGGFNFWTSNSASAPDKIINLSTNGLLTNKNVKVALNNDEHVVGASTASIRNLGNSTNNTQSSSVIALGNDIIHTSIRSDLGSNRPYTDIRDVDGNNSRITASSLAINSNYNAGNPLNTVSILNSNIALVDNDQGLSANYGANQAEIVDGDKTGNLNAVYTQHVNSTTATTSVLTSSDLTFNGISLKNTVADNSASIVNINHILPQIVVPQLTFSSPAIYADSTIIPSTNTTYQNTYGVFGWYTKNTVASTKFNFYFPPQPNMKVSDLKGIYYEMFSNCTSLGAYPFLTIYTKPTGNNDYRPWYHSSYTVVPSVFQGANSFVQCFGNLQGLSYNSANVWGNYVYSPLIASDVQNPKGDYQPTQEILFISLGSNSASAVNSLDCSLLKLGMISTFTQEFLFL